MHILCIRMVRIPNGVTYSLSDQPHLCVAPLPNSLYALIVLLVEFNTIIIRGIVMRHSRIAGSSMKTLPDGVLIELEDDFLPT